ncbi:16S rRNA (uracil(1498)-N(3))-methyltransferase [Thiomicrorhabdus indica]|uniref:16S rRNA (uracil(1498)-N(3))-methyltransferase n=1 Tax=Thiomicrorhabdus indica TaxID=2267253 RepID=UPI00102DB27A|nr:16S rRNA (uracil(1498)-N(3))-methyltransferase [Thiomicrorhabdus indica]
MRISRFYLPERYVSGSSLELSKEQAHYALTVLRLKDGHQIEVFDGKGHFASAVIQHTSRRSANVVLEEVQTAVNESPLKTVLLQGISKGDRMDYSIQKAVELGVGSIQPLFTERVDVKLQGDKLEKRRAQWQSIAINACEQSGRAFVPEILPLISLEEYLANNTVEFGIVCDPYAEHTIASLPPPNLDRPVTILVGPEGGLSEKEVMKAEQNGFSTVRLGPRILRTETAGPAMLTIAQALWGDF